MVSVPATIRIEGASTLEVELYLGGVSKAHGGPETLDELLNRPRAFLPARLAGAGDNFLIRRAAIQTVQVGSDLDVVSYVIEGLPVCVDIVRLQLKDGSEVEGTLRSEIPPARLSDFFNQSELAFVPLEIDEGVTYVNKLFVSIVWL